MVASSTPEFRSPARFRLVSRLGGGSGGEVFEALDLERDARVALKTLRTPSAEALRLLKNEFRSVQDIEHPNLVKLGELFEDDGQWFFTMEFVRGVSFVEYVCGGILRERGRAAPRFNESRLRDALPQLVRGIAALHTARKIHRDIKPANILVTREGRVVVVDFGVMFDAHDPTRSGQSGMVGTVFYMAPEQIIGEESVGPAADWYGVGSVLYHALTGRPPFEGSFTDVLERKIIVEPPPPSAFAAGLPPDLESLCVDLLRLDPAARPNGTDILRRLADDAGIEEAIEAPAASSVFVGRRRELAALTDAFETSGQGGAVAVFVHGESGVGKSALMRYFTERRVLESPEEVTVLRGRCYERESVPFKGLDGVIDGLSRFLLSLPREEVDPLLPDDFDLVCRAFPVLADVRPVAAGASGGADHDRIVNPNERRARLYGAMRELFVRVGARWRLVVAVDDLQWTDTDSLALLLEVLRPPGAPRVLFLSTMRVATETGNSARVVHEHIARIPGDVRHLHVDKLSSDDAERLTAFLLGDEPASGLAEDIRSIALEARGHPLFIDELVRQRAMTGKSAGALKLDDALWSRVERLEAPSRRLLEVVAVAGRPLAQQKAANAAGLDAAVLFSAATALRHAHLVAAMGVNAQDTLDAYHDRVRESVLAHLDADMRRTLHGRLALAEEQSTSPDAEALAVHWEGAENLERAAEYAVLAGDRASRALAFDRAVDWYRHALAMGARNAGEVRAKLAAGLTDGGRDAAAAEVRLTMAEEAPELEALDLRRRAAEQFLLSGHFDRGYQLLRAVLEALDERFPRSPLAVIFWVIVVRLRLRLRGLAFSAGDVSALDRRALVRIDSMWSAGAGFAMTDNIRGAYFQTRNLLLALATGDTRRVARAIAMEVCFTSAGGSAKRARTLALLAAAKAAAARVGSPDAPGMAHVAEGYASYMIGDWRHAKANLSAAEECFRDRCVGVNWELNTTRTMLYRTLVFRGELGELARRVPQVLREAEHRGDRYCEVNVRTIPLTMLHLAADKADEARKALEEVHASLPAGVFLVQHFYTLIARGQVDAYAGDPKRALERLHATWPAVKRSLLLRVESLRVSALDQRGRCALAVAATAAPDLARALVTSAETDAAALLRLDVPWATAFAWTLHAGIAAVRGDRAATIESLTRAGDLFDQTEMFLHAAAARLRRGQLVGGTAGETLAREAAAWMATQDVQSHEAMARLCIPAVERLRVS